MSEPHQNHKSHAPPLRRPGRSRVHGPRLQGPGWTAHIRATLGSLLRRGAGRGLPVTLDFDNTVICGDIGEATMAILVRRGLLGPARLAPTLSPTFRLRDGRLVQPEALPDLTRYYEAYGAPTMHGRADPNPLANAYVWAVESMQGLRASDVVEASAEAFACSVSGRLNPIEVTAGHSVYPAPYFYPEMVELIAELLRLEFDVWIVSASNVWSVRFVILEILNPMLRESGLRNGLAPDHVLGAATLLTNSRNELFKDAVLVRESTPYANLDRACLSRFILTSRLQYPVPVYSGKVGAVWDALGRPPFLAAGDSPGDHALLTFSEHRLWIARLENPDLQAATARLIRKSSPERWMVQPTLLDRSPGFVPSLRELARRLDPVPAAVRSSTRRLSSFEPRGSAAPKKSVGQWLRKYTLAMMVSGVFLNASTVDEAGEQPPQPGEGTELVFALEPAASPIWRGEIGEGYRTSAQTMSLEVGAAYGPAAMGSQEQHHLVLLSVSYGHMVGPMFGEDHWWRGNFELRLELFGGLQFSPDYEWLVGLTPHLRYHFATGSRWVPFLDGGLGVSFTGIGPPDLGSTFEFNVQCAAGIHWYLGDGLALTVETRYIHLSNAGISDQNYGLNAFIGMLGLTRFF